MPVINKKCADCGKIKPLEDFYINRSAKYGRTSYCKDCSRVRSKKYRPKRTANSESLLKMKERMQEMRLYIRSQKEKPCTDCGIQYPFYVMQFDHRDPSQKSFGLSGSVSRSRAMVDAEIAKCDVVCANCHAERTHQQRLTSAKSDDNIEL